MENLQHKIFKTASELFRKRGLRAVTIDDLCAELRISKKTFYSYFRQKEDLILQMVENIHQEKTCKNEKILSAKKNHNAIDNVMDILSLMKVKDNDKMLPLHDELKKYYPDVHQQLIDKGKRESTTFFEKSIEKGIREGIFRNDMDMPVMAEFLAAQMHISIGMFSGTSKRKFQEMFEFLSDIYIRVVVNEKGLKYYYENYVNKRT